jgi:hypothetical protein
VRDVLAIVFSPRRIEEALASHEALGFKTAFITGYSETTAHRVAWELANEYPAEVYLLSYDDEVVTRQQADTVLELQARTGQIVSGWFLIGKNSPYSSSVRPSWGRGRVHSIPPNAECFYTGEEIRAHPDELISTLHFPYALTAIPRAAIGTPFRVVEQIVNGVWPFPNPDGSKTPFNKGMAGDWAHSQDLMDAGWELWTARDAEVDHLAPVHAVPHWPFTMDADHKGVSWDRRPR